MMKRLVLLLILTLTAVSCSSKNQTVESEAPDTPAPVESIETEPEGTTLVSPDGTSQITVPEDWNETDELNDVAIIQAANPVKEQYVVVIEDNKEDFTDITLEQFSDLTSQLVIDGLDNPEESTSTSLTVNGNPALQKEFKGSFDNINVIYLHTSIETPMHFYQVFTWSLKSRFEENRGVFEEVTQSFQEVTP